MKEKRGGILWLRVACILINHDVLFYDSFSCAYSLIRESWWPLLPMKIASLFIEDSCLISRKHDFMSWHFKFELYVMQNPIWFSWFMMEQPHKSDTIQNQWSYFVVSFDCYSSFELKDNHKLLYLFLVRGCVRACVWNHERCASG